MFKHRLDFFAIAIFHQIIHRNVDVKLPTYITLGQPTNLRFYHKDHLSFVCKIKQRIIKKIKIKMDSKLVVNHVLKKNRIAESLQPL